MSDSLDKYVPEFDEDEARSKLVELTREQIVEMLIFSYKLRRVVERWADEDRKKLQKIQQILSESSSIPNMPGVLSADDLRRMFGDGDERKP